MIRWMQPASDRVLLREILREEVTDGGIILPDKSRDKSQIAVVVAVGPGRLADDHTRVPMHYQRGDVVVIARYGGTTVDTLDRERTKYLVVRQDEIMGTLKGEVLSFGADLLLLQSVGDKDPEFAPVAIEGGVWPADEEADAPAP